MIERLEPLRVVMIDDDPDDIFLTKVICKRSSVPIDFIGLNSGSALYEHIKNRGIGSIDVILLDINMPVENGYDVLRKLRTYPDIDEVTVIMFSTSRRLHEKQLTLELGGNDFMEKPARNEDAGKFLNLLTTCHSKLQPALQLSELSKPEMYLHNQ